MERYLSDARQSLRIFRRSPGLALSAVVALAMGIGLTTTMFSIVRGGTRSLPFDRPDQLVVLTRTMVPQGYDVDAGLFDFLAWSRSQSSYQGLAAFQERSVNLGSDGQQPERRTAAFVTTGAFSLLGVEPVLGRLPAADDARPGAPAVALIGHELWRARFAGDSGIVGREIRIDGTPHTVIGVMPPRFGFPVRSALWLPLAVAGEPAPVAGGTGLRVFGRLRDGVLLDQARAEVATIAARIAADHPETHRQLSARVLPFAEMEMAANTAAILLLMLAVVSFVLLIASANVANLLLARAAARAREVAVRTALGATRARIVSSHVAEAVALAAMGGLLGVAFAHGAVGLFARATANIIDAFWIDFRVDWTVLLFATASVALAGLFAGLIPGLRAAAGSPAEALKDASGGSSGVQLGRLGRALVTIEVALASGFLIMTMTFTRAAVALRAIELPFDARTILTGQVSIPFALLDSTPVREQLVRDLSDRLASHPGLEASALVSVLPGRGSGNWTFTLDSPAAGVEGTITTGVAIVTPGFFDVVGAAPVQGRLIAWSDGPDAADVAVVNQSWVRRYSPDRHPLGRTIWLGTRQLQIVGVVPDLQMQDPEDRRGDGIYASMLQVRPYAIRIMARGAGDPQALVPVLRETVAVVDPELPLFEVADLHEAIYSEKRVLDAFGVLFLVAGVGALILTQVGVYGVVSFWVTRRSREIGVRVALGATRPQVVRLVLRQGVRLIALGTGIGLVLAFGISQVLAAVTDIFTPAAPLTYVAIAAMLVSTAALALYRPVRRVLTLEVTDTLRQE